MTNKEAVNELKCYHREDGTVPEEIVLAIKALEIVDDVNHKVYRNENCPQKHKCYDYQGYHCAGCSWEKKGGKSMTNNEAIKLIQGIEEDGRNVTTEHVGALDLAIKALEFIDENYPNTFIDYLNGIKI